MLILALKGLSLVVAHESRMTAGAKFLIQPSRIEWYIYSKKKIMKIYFPLQLLVVLLTKSLAILRDSSFTEVQLIRLRALQICCYKILVMYVTSCKEMPRKCLTNKNVTSLTETWKSGSFSQG